MFIRKKTNKNGSVSVQIVSKIKGTNFIIKTVGVSKDLNLIDKFEADAQYEMENLLGLQRINFDLNKEQDFVYTFLNGIENFELVGPEMLLGKIFDEIGFNAIKDDLCRYFVITRLVYPVSKLKTVDYLYQYKGIHFDVSKIYRYLDI